MLLHLLNPTNLYIFILFITLKIIQCERRSHFIPQKLECEKYVSFVNTKKSDPQSFTNRCVKSFNSKLNETNYRGRNVFLLGNSVLRHYSFTIKSFFDGLFHDLSLDREQEKRICGGPWKSNSCKHPTKDQQTCIAFMWQNSLGYEHLHDDKRDICVQYSSTRACYKVIFNHAKNKDILIINSRPMDLRRFKEIGLTSTTKNSFGEVYRELELTSVSLAIELVDIVLDYFPGTIIWVNYPYIKYENETEQKIVNDGYASFNKITYEAIQTKISEKHRLKYIDLIPLQKENLNLYVDNIHHQGALSQLVIEYIFQNIAPSH